MNDDKPIDPDLLKRMMMGEFSSYSSPYKNVKPNQSKRNLELDLHFDKLYHTKSGLSSFEKFTLQLEAVDEFIQSARRKSLRSAYVIVGKGEGVLKKKVSNHLTKSNIQHNVVSDPPYFGNALKLKL